MHGPKEVLNELRWRHDALAEAEIHYVHRGAPGDARVVRGSDIIALHHSFFEMKGRPQSVMIPYHRVFRIDRRATTIWRRRTASKARP